MVPFRQWPDPWLVIDFHLSQQRTLGCSISLMFGSDSVRSHHIFGIWLAVVQFKVNVENIGPARV